jgi:PAS domain S-box-containing protein
MPSAPRKGKGAKGSAKAAARRRASLKRPAHAHLGQEDLRVHYEQLEAENEQLREAVETIETTLQRYAEHYDHAPFGYLTLDRGGIIREINRKACAMLALERPRALGGVFRALVPTAALPALARHLSACRRYGVASARLQVRRSDGSLVMVELTSRHATDEKREYYPTAMVEVAPEEADGEREYLMAVAREALEQGAARTDLLATISHELRSPLTPLLAAVSALEQRQGDSPEIATLCQIIRRSANVEARLIDDLLDATRISRGKMALQRAPTELHEVVREAVEQAEALARSKEVGLTVALGAGRSLVDGDTIRLGQVFANLLGNAIKFTSPGGQVIVRSWDSGDDIAVEISDSGAGIRPAALSRLFVPFEQVDRPPGSLGGLGLGLAISKGIVELHQGRISASSVGPGKGARFVVSLPLLRPRALAASNGKSAARILLVEDNADTAEALTVALGSSGYQVNHAPSVASALKADLTAVDLVVSDLRLTDGDGRNLLRQLRGRGAVTAIALSGYGADEDKQTAEEAGFFAHLTKPVELDLLTATIERALAHKRGA